MNILIVILLICLNAILKLACIYFGFKLIALGEHLSGSILIIFSLYQSLPFKYESGGDTNDDKN